MTTEQTLILIVFFGFVLTPFFLKKLTKINYDSSDSFATGTRNYNWFYITAGLSATFIGGAAILNLGSLGYQFGWYALADVLPTSLALVIVGFVLIKKIKRKNVETLGQLIGEDRKIKAVSGLLSTVVYTLITAAQIIALTTILQTYYDYSFEVVALFSTISIGFYISFGGYKSVTLTDVIQFILMSIFYLGVVGVKLLVDIQNETIVEETSFLTMPLDIIALLGLTLFFVPTSQDVHVRIQSAKNQFEAKKGMLISALFYLLFGILSISIGIYSKRIGIITDNPDNIVPQFLSETLNEFAIIPMIAIIAIIISTLDSMIFNSVTSLNYDLLGSFKKDKTNFNKESKISTFIILGSALVIAIYYPSILSLILTALILYVSVLLPLLIGKSLKILNKYSFIISLFFLTSISILEFLKIDFSFRYIVYSIAHFFVLLIFYKIFKTIQSND